MTFEEDIKKLEEEYAKKILPLKELTKKYEEEYNSGIAKIFELKKKGFENMEEYNLWNSLEKNSPEYLILEEKRQTIIHQNLKNELQKKKEIYQKSFNYLSSSKELTLTWENLMEQYDSKRFSYSQLSEIIYVVVKKGKEMKYVNFMKIIIDKDKYLVCPCGVAFYPKSGYCERDVKHTIIMNKELPDDIFDWDLECFLEEPPLFID